MTTPIPETWTRKPPEIQAMFVGALTEEVQGVVDWITFHMGPDDVLDYSDVMGPSISVFRTIEGQDPKLLVFVSQGAYLCRDVNGNWFRMDPDTLKAFYDRVP